MGHFNIWSTSIKNFMLSQMTPGMSLWNIAAVTISEYHKRHLELLIQQLDLQKEASLFTIGNSSSAYFRHYSHTKCRVHVFYEQVIIAYLE